MQAGVKGEEVMKSIRHETLPLHRVVLLALLLIVVTLWPARLVKAQGTQLGPPPLPVDPTPIKDLLTDSERTAIADARAHKKAVEAYLNISDAHLDAASKAVDDGGTDVAERELDISTKSAVEACHVAFDDGKEGSKQGTRSAWGKRIEQRLYAQIKKLEGIRRRFPNERVAFAEAALDSVRKLRVHALNETLAMGEVLTENSGKKKQADSSAPPELLQFHLTNTARVSLPASCERAVSYQDAADYLSDDEQDAVKEAQDIDKRAKLFMKIADRRIEAATHTSDIPPPAKPNPADRPHPPRKGEPDDSKEGNALEKLSRAELLRHYSRAIEELMDKMEDAHDRNPKSSALKRALNILADGTDRQLKTLEGLKPDMKDEAEDRALRDAISKAEEANKGAKEALKAGS